jgi:hypothetical protein
MAINSQLSIVRVGRHADGNGIDKLSSQSFNASDLGLTVGRTTTTPTTPIGIVAALRDAVKKWDTLASADRADGGAITAASRTAARLASLLTDSHGADADAVRSAVVSRFTDADGNALTDADVLAAIIPDADADADADTDADDAPDADADADADAS